jgi:hypothetical protein
MEEKIMSKKKGVAGYWLVMFFVLISFAIVFVTGGILRFIQMPYGLHSFERTAKNWETRIVKVECGEELSTGFIMETMQDDGENYAYIITSYHGVDNGNDVKVFINGINYTANKLSWNEYIDIAVLEVNCDITFAKAESAKINLAEEVIAIGYPGNGSITAEKGIINATTCLDVNSSLYPLLCYDVSAYVQAGMSGCPILSKDGKLIGVGVRTKKGTVGEEEVVFSSDNYVVPYSVMMAEYDRARYHRTAKKTHYELSESNGVITALFADGKQVCYDGKLTINGQEIAKVQNVKVKNIIDFIAQVSVYGNRNGANNAYTDITLKSGEKISLKVVNE